MNLTLDMINKAIELLENTGKMPVLYFSPLVNTILEGEFIDKTLNCKENEKGFIVPESMKNTLYTYKSTEFLIPSFIERNPRG